MNKHQAKRNANSQRYSGGCTANKPLRRIGCINNKCKRDAYLKSLVLIIWLKWIRKVSSKGG